MPDLLHITYRPVWALTWPSIVALLILVSAKRPNLRESWTLLGSAALCLTVLSMTPFVLDHGPIEFSWFHLFPEIDFSFKVDALSLIFATTSSCLWILVSVYSIGYMRSLNEHAQTRYYFSFALALLGTMGVALAANLVTMFIFYEILTISTYPLVAHEESAEAVAAGHKYLAYLLGGGIFFLVGILLTYSLVGTTDFNYQGILRPALDSTSKLTMQIVFFFFLIGFAKAAWMPVHGWLPSAMVAPTPVSALLHAVAVVKAGVFGIIRVVCHIYGIELMQILGLGLALAVVAAFTIIVANIYAIGQNNLKRLLAYSTINQLSFIILGVALLSPMAVTGAMLHIPFHGFMKITLFLCAGAIAAITGKKNISDMAGLGRGLPITLGAFLIGAFGMCGIPPLAGFISKWHVALGAVESGAFFILLIIFGGSLLDVVYFFPVIRTAFFGNMSKSPPPTNEREPIVDAHPEKKRVLEYRQAIHLFMIVPLAITAIFSIWFCLFPNTLRIYDLAQMAVKNIFGGM
ncbi:NADH-ubiquinone oxidoreductase chain L (EC [Olavius algarvensis Delta 1 endosymbiont]|nr:NADH-ubiquinone oxidoreductase chain L (EC [Olavius algarvensis Delta 1 endosymbiont]